MLALQLCLKETGAFEKAMKFSKPSMVISQQIVGEDARAVSLTPRL
jgi:hypothetical protein